MTETKYKCQGCGADLGESQVEKYGEGLCHVVPVQDRHGDLEPNPCGPVIDVFKSKGIPVKEEK